MVFLFVPNILGYGRIVLLLYSCYFMSTNCMASVIAYVISGLLDAVDGHAARMLNQSTKFGAMLDMLVDRCATMCLLACLIVFYPAWMFPFQLSMIVDIASHWLHVHSSILGGSQSHKAIDLSANPALHYYYHNKAVLFSMCLGNEAFYSALYVYHFYSNPTILGYNLWGLIACLAAPVALVKFGINLLQLVAASINVAEIDRKERTDKRTT